MTVLQKLCNWKALTVALLLSAFVFATKSDAKDDNDDRCDWGAVFSTTNETGSNQLAVFCRNDNGELSEPVFVPTGGKGTGGGLGNQGAVVLSECQQYLYAVNAGSNSISVFSLGRKGPKLVQVVESGGSRPVSLTVKCDLLYVLNAGGAAGGTDSIAGFFVGKKGRLTPISNSQATLSAANTGPAQISFSPDGDSLLVTEKATNLIDTFAIRNCVPVARKSTKSVGNTPFGFSFNCDGYLIVSEAFGGMPNASAVSSYNFDDDSGKLTPITKSALTNQTAACWISITENGRYAYTTNTASNSITGYQIKRGKLTSLNANGITGSTGKGPTDLALLENSLLYSLNAAEGSISVFGIQKGGSLNATQTISGLPARSTGLAVR